jgi:hypothetical protein
MKFSFFAVNSDGYMFVVLSDFHAVLCVPYFNFHFIPQCEKSFNFISNRRIMLIIIEMQSTYVLSLNSAFLNLQYEGWWFHEDGSIFSLRAAWSPKLWLAFIDVTWSRQLIE